jgi:hypothetical protein
MGMLSFPLESDITFAIYDLFYDKQPQP